MAVHNPRFSIVPGRAVFDKSLSASQLHTLCVIGTFTDKEGWCFPSLQTIADAIGKTRQAVSYDVLALEAHGYLEVHRRRAENGSKTSNLYRVIFDFPVDTNHELEADLATCQAPLDTLSSEPLDTLSSPGLDTLSSAGLDIRIPIKEPTQPVRVVKSVMPPVSGKQEPEYVPNPDEPRRRGRRTQPAAEVTGLYYGRKQFAKNENPAHLQFGDAFWKLSKREPANGYEIADWTKTFNEWTDIGVTVRQIEAAWLKSRPSNGNGGGFTVTRPGSLTNVIRSNQADEKLQQEEEATHTVQVGPAGFADIDFDA